MMFSFSERRDHQLASTSSSVSAFGYDAEDIDREIAADNQRADELGLVFDSDPRHDKASMTADSKPPDDLNHLEDSDDTILTNA